MYLLCTERNKSQEKNASKQCDKCEIKTVEPWRCRKNRPTTEGGQ